MINRRKAMWWIFISLILTVFNVSMLIFLFGLAYYFDYSQPAAWLELLFFGAWLLFGPIVMLLAQIDAVIRIPDYWYYVGGIANGIIWANTTMYIASKNENISRLFLRLSI